MAAVAMNHDLIANLKKFRADALDASGAQLSMLRARSKDLVLEGAQEALATSHPGLSAKRRFTQLQKGMLWGIGLLIVVFAIVSPQLVFVALNGLFIIYCLALCLLRFSRRPGAARMHWAANW